MGFTPRPAHWGPALTIKTFQKNPAFRSSISSVNFRRLRKIVDATWVNA